jgi:hypothetical protein
MSNSPGTSSSGSRPIPASIRNESMQVEGSKGSGMTYRMAYVFSLPNRTCLPIRSDRSATCMALLLATEAWRTPEGVGRLSGRCGTPDPGEHPKGCKGVRYLVCVRFVAPAPNQALRTKLDSFATTFGP